MLIKYMKSIVLNDKIKRIINLYEKQYHKCKINQIAYYKERLKEKSCYDCKYVMLNRKVECVNRLNQDESKKDIPEIKGCKYYAPDKKIIKRNFLIK